RQRPLRGAVRVCLPDLRHRAQRGADARRARGKAGQRSFFRTDGGDCGAGQNYPAPGAEGAGLVTVSTHVLDATLGAPAVGVAVSLASSGPDGWQAIEA